MLAINLKYVTISGLMDFAIIETGGKQYIVEGGKSLSVELLPNGGGEGSNVVFDKVLLTKNGDDIKIGTPYLDGVQIEATIEVNGRAKKISVVRYRSKSRYFKRRGHRQPFTKVLISDK